ncbi:uncharacterized protein LOC131158599 [Malania oleifera]|uniref:uncharacterized protein LOC131158599 n=1 Tax=Malania oleifera TaxID=397392 RepID=UPI0025AE933F|nr:uncharacterized protein LOC131158599 [Malania oleifera]
MTNASDFALGAVLGQRVGNKPSIIYYASRTLNDAQKNYTTTEKELLAIVFALEKFHSYVIGSLITIRDKKGVKNVVADHLSRLQLPDISVSLSPLNDDFPDERLFAVSRTPLFADIVNYLVTDQMPDHWLTQDKRKFLDEVGHYYFDNPHLFKYCSNQLVRRCVPDDEFNSVMHFCHGGTFTVDYVSKWVEAIPCRTNDHRVVIRFLKELFARFGMPKAIISDGGLHFCNKPFEKLMQKYGVTHKVSTPYHPQTNDKFRDVSLQINFSLDDAKDLRKLQVCELEESRREAYDNACLAKERMKKLKSRWGGPYIIEKVHSYGTVEIVDPKNDNSFTVND